MNTKLNKLGKVSKKLRLNFTKYKPNVNLDKLDGNNPFLDNLTINVIELAKDTVIQDNFPEIEYKDTYNTLNLRNSYLVEKKRYVKRFPNIDVYKMKPRTIVLLHWIEDHVDMSKDYFWLNVYYTMRMLNITEKPLRSALNELIDNNIILPVGKDYPNYFWFNPEYFFAGNRIAKYYEHVNIIQTYIKKKDK